MVLCDAGRYSFGWIDQAPETQVFYQVFEQHIDRYVAEYEERFEPRSGPHCHAVISDGVWTRKGEFLELPSLDTASVCELFRRLLLRRLYQEERLSERFMENLLSGVHPGFSVFAGEPLSSQDPDQLERLARYITRPLLAADSVRRMTACSKSQHLPTPGPARPIASSIPSTGSTPSRPRSSSERTEHHEPV